MTATRPQPVAEMTPTEKIFWAEMNSGKATERSMVICYAYLRAQHAASKDAKWWEYVDRKVRRHFGWKSESDEFLRFVASAAGITYAAEKMDYAGKVQ